MKSRLGLLLVVSALLALTAFGLVQLRPSSDDSATIPSIEVIGLSGPAELGAGESFTLQVNGPDDANGRALLLFRSGLHAFTREVSISDGAGTVAVNGLATEHAGVLTISPVQASSVEVAHHIDIAPGATSQPVVPLIGPRTVRADGIEETMAVTLPIDKFGNVASEGTVVDLTVTRNTGVVPLVNLDSVVDNLIAWSWIGSTTKTGVASVAATSEGVAGRVIEFEEVPLPPVVIPLIAPDTTVVGDGRTLHEIRTLPLADQFGNEVQDGIATTFFMRDAVGVRHLPGLVIDGTARVVFEAPSKPGVMEVWAVIQGVRSAVLEVEVEPAVDLVPFEVYEIEGVTFVEIGPVELAAGGLVPDGTAVDAIGSEDGMATEQALLENGRATIEIDHEEDPDFELSGLELSVLDARVRVWEPS